MQLRVGKQMGLLPSPVVQILNMVPRRLLRANSSFPLQSSGLGLVIGWSPSPVFFFAELLITARNKSRTRNASILSSLRQRNVKSCKVHQIARRKAALQLFAYHQRGP